MDPSNYQTNRQHMMNRQEYIPDRQEHGADRPEYTTARPEYSVSRPLHADEFIVDRPEYSVNRSEQTQHRPEYTSRPEHVARQEHLMRREDIVLNRPEQSLSRQEYSQSRQEILGNRLDHVLNRTGYTAVSQEVQDYSMSQTQDTGSRPDAPPNRPEYSSDKSESIVNRLEQGESRPGLDLSGRADRPETVQNRLEYGVDRQEHFPDLQENRQHRSSGEYRHESGVDKAGFVMEESERPMNTQDNAHAMDPLITEGRGHSGSTGRTESSGRRPELVTDRPECPREMKSDPKEQLMECVFQKVHDLVTSFGCEVFLKMVGSESSSLVYGTEEFLEKYFDTGLTADHKDVFIGVDSDTEAKLKKKMEAMKEGTVKTAVSDGNIGKDGRVEYADQETQTGDVDTEIVAVPLRRTRRRKQPSPKRAIEPAVGPVKRKRGRPTGNRKTNKQPPAVEASQDALRGDGERDLEKSDAEDDDDDGDDGDDENDKDYEPKGQPQTKRKYTFITRKPRRVVTPGEETSSVCEVCGETFKKAMDLKRHRKKHAKEKLTCKECGKTLGGYSNLQQHVRAVHKKERPFRCDACEKTFTSATHLTMHREIHATEEEKKLQCDKCGKRFTHSTTLKAHVRMHHREKIYACETCGRKFPQKSNLVVHIRCHTGEKPYQCDQCGRTFSQPSSLRSHKFIHTGQKPFKCTVCEYAFVRADDLKAHFRRHTGERPFQCEVCGKRFVKSQQMVDHKRHHTGDKRYKCRLCGGTFFKSGHLKRHMAVHSGEKPFQCPVCGKKVNRADNLRTHMKVHRKDDGQASSKKPKTSPVAAETTGNASHTHVPPPQPEQPRVTVPVLQPPQLRPEAERMYVEPLAIQSAIDALSAIQHDHW